MSNYSKFALGFLVVIGLVAANLFAHVDIKTQPVSASQAFDHSNCQYPDRWSNPVDGCDNSDPAVPECIKGFSTQEGEAQCIADFVKQNQPPVETAPVQSAPVTVNKCEGK